MTDDELIDECFKWLGSDLNEGALAAEYCDRLIALARIGAALIALARIGAYREEK